MGRPRDEEDTKITVTGTTIAKMVTVKTVIVIVEMATATEKAVEIITVTETTVVKKTAIAVLIPLVTEITEVDHL